MQDPVDIAGNNTSYIDAHQHFWRYNEQRDAWIDDSMQAIRRDFLPGDFQLVLAENGIGGCVVVQSDQSQEENEFHLENAANNPFIKGVVGWVDLQSETVEEQLEWYSGVKMMKGFRHVLQGEPQRDMMLKPEFKRGIRLLEQYGFTYDLLVYPDQLPYVLELVRAFPEQPFVLDHLGKPQIKEGDISSWKSDIEQLALCDNVCCKISGMVTEADWKHWTPDQLAPYIDTVVNAFGMKRLMFGSDWPVCLLAATYSQVLQVTQQYFSTYSRDEQDQFFGVNAREFYNL